MEVNPTRTMSVNLKSSYEQAEEYANKLKAGDFNPYHHVTVQHEDGTLFNFSSAFARKLWIKNEKYIAVFTEHQGLHVFAEGDLDTKNCYGGYRYYEIKPLKIKKL